MPADERGGKFWQETRPVPESFGKANGIGAGHTHRARTATTAEVEGLVFEIAQASEQLLTTHGFGAGEEGESPTEDDARTLFQTASLHRATAAGPRAANGLRWQQVFGGRASAPTERWRPYDACNRMAGAWIGAGDRTWLEQLCRYIACYPRAPQYDWTVAHLPIRPDQIGITRPRPARPHGPRRASAGRPASPPRRAFCTGCERNPL